MEDNEFFWKLCSVAGWAGNIILVWLRIKNSDRPQKINIEKQPVEVIEGRKPATMDNIKVIHHRMNNIEKRLDKMDEENANDKKEIIDEIIKMREQSHEQFATLNRAIGRLEGERISR